MDYDFQSGFHNYRFNSSSLLLTKDGQTLVIRNTEAKLLAFFLASPHQVFSKDAILENVWAGKVVSEQAVFQAISNLRTLFGEEAIKTFPKKGYQWQLPLVPHTSTVAVNPTGQGAQSNSTRRYLQGAGILAGIGLLLVLLLLRVDQTIPAAPTQTLHLIFQPLEIDGSHTGSPDIDNRFQQAFFAAVEQQSTLVATLAPPGFSSVQVAASPPHAFNHYTRSQKANILFSGRIRAHQNQFHLRFVLQGRENQWTGYLSAANLADLASEMLELLLQTSARQALWESKDQRLVNAQLQLLHSDHPESLPILHQLVDNFILIGDSQNALIRAVELEQKAQGNGKIPYQALALSMQGIAEFGTIDIVDIEESIDKLNRAVALAETIDDAFLQSTLMENFLFLYHQQRNWTALEEVMLRALALAKVAQAPQQQAQILRVLSIASNKFGKAEKRDDYLARAYSILDQHQFPGESYALLEDMAGMYQEDPLKQERFYWQALNRFQPEQEAWVKERAQEHLIYLYIHQERWDEALAVFAQETSFSGAELLMIAKVHYFQKNLAFAEQQAIAAFRQANLTGEYMIAVDSSLLLAQLYQALSKPNLQQNSIEFIRKNATPLWMKSNQEILTKLDSLAD